ncbi:hypothetical protein CK203_101815 [Vitis vinifera]|uniref:Uncharacterized protein n=1 Tax=Vitis vinifera TaxID=29760 RepID=A0A438ESZ3_VITVI|nr:hypothetical protein CK203_101815 [Vitis vinifera]
MLKANQLTKVNIKDWLGTLKRGLIFSKNDHLQVEPYIDADWAGSLDHRRSTSGYCTPIGELRMEKTDPMRLFGDDKVGRMCVCLGWVGGGRRWVVGGVKGVYSSRTIDGATRFLQQYTSYLNASFYGLDNNGWDIDIVVRDLH